MTINACRAYFLLNNGLTAGTPTPGEQTVRAFKLNFEDSEATGVAVIDNGKLIMDNSVYDLQGRKIDNRKSVNRQLPKGIYLYGGKKVVIK